MLNELYIPKIILKRKTKLEDSCYQILSNYYKAIVIKDVVLR